MTRRIEELVALLTTEPGEAGDDSSDFLPGVSVAGGAAGLRLEVAGLRGELGALRSEVAELVSGLGPQLRLLVDDGERLREEIRELVAQTPAEGPGASGAGFAEDLQARVTAFEDALEELAERLEAFVRDSTEQTHAQLSAVLDRLPGGASGELVAATEPPGSVAEELVRRMELALGVLAAAVRESLEDLANSVTAGPWSPADAEPAPRRPTGGGEAARGMEETTAAEGSGLSASAAVGVSRVLEVLEQLAAALADALPAVVEQVGARVDTRFAEVAAQVRGPLEELRGPLEELRTQVGDLFEAGARARESQDPAAETAALVQAVSLGVADPVAAASADVLSGVENALGQLEHALGERLEPLAVAIRDGFADLAGGVGGLAEQLGELGEMRRAVVAEVARASQESVTVAAAQARAELASVTDAISAAARLVEAPAGVLDGLRRELAGAAVALVDYLDERDRRLEAERDRVLGEVLEDFAQGLSVSERRSLAERMRRSVDRRRDARDAERHRALAAGGSTAPLPPVGDRAREALAVLLEEAAPAAPSEGDLAAAVDVAPPEAAGPEAAGPEAAGPEAAGPETGPSVSRGRGRTTTAPAARDTEVPVPAAPRRVTRRSPVAAETSTAVRAAGSQATPASRASKRSGAASATPSSAKTPPAGASAAAAPTKAAPTKAAPSTTATKRSGTRGLPG